MFHAPQPISLSLSVPAPFLQRKVGPNLLRVPATALASDAARWLAQMLAALLQTVKLAHNSSALLSGGRGVPQQAVADVDPANLQDGQVEDAILGALFMAARPCGPPNRLSSPSMEVVEDKYLNSTCVPPLPVCTLSSRSSVALSEVPCLTHCCFPLPVFVCGWL